MTPVVRPRVGVSSCLLGEEVRFDGGHKRFRFLTDELGLYVDWVPYCPEMEIGLGAPREPIRLTADGRLVNRSGTADHTVAMASLPVPGGLDGTCSRPSRRVAGFSASRGMDLMVRLRIGAGGGCTPGRCWRRIRCWPRRRRGGYRIRGCGRRSSSVSLPPHGCGCCSGGRGV